MAATFPIFIKTIEHNYPLTKTLHDKTYTKDYTLHSVRGKFIKHGGHKRPKITQRQHNSYKNRHTRDKASLEHRKKVVQIDT